MSGASTPPGRRRIVVDHLARVEGHAGITVELAGEGVEAVRFDVFEGIRLIEGLVRGRSWEDIAPIVSRICSICSVAHTLTSLRVTEQVFGVPTAPRTELLRDLLWRGENIASHALHLFLLAAPDYLGHPSAQVMAGSDPDAVRLGLRLKKVGNRIQEVVGGRAIHPVNAVPGGFGSVPRREILLELRKEIEAAREDAEAAVAWLGALPEQPKLEGETTFVALRPDRQYGYDDRSELVALRGGARTVLPVKELTRLAPEQARPHSHAKHSLLDGRPFMVGALARLTVNLDRLPPSGLRTMERLGLQVPSADPLDNNKAQAVELVVDLEQALETLDAFLAEPAEPEPLPEVRPRAGKATVATEAPRGTLVHTYEYDAQGVLAAANVVTPTAINAAMLEDHVRAEVSRQGVDDEPALLRRLEMIARAYDPCVSCSVHLLRRR